VCVCVFVAERKAVPKSPVLRQMPPPSHLPLWLRPTLNCQYCISVSRSGLQIWRSLWHTHMQPVLAV